MWTIVQNVAALVDVNICIDDSISMCIIMAMLLAAYGFDTMNSILIDCR